MSNIDWSRLSTKAMRDAEEASHQRAANAKVEDAWQLTQMRLIADQLIALEDADPDAMDVTEAQWRAYRTKIRAWKDGGNPDFPDATKRPTL
jgi:hypothetical protein